MAFDSESNDVGGTGKFKKGNAAWKARSTHGKEKIFSTPGLLWEAACEYFQWVDDNPLYEHEWKVVDKELTAVSNPKMRPYTLIGLCLYLVVNTAYFRTFRAQMDKKQDELEAGEQTAQVKLQLQQIADYNTVIHCIEETIYKHKFEGASSGFFNANIISRDLGLADKKQIEGNINLSDKPVEFD
jgi:hypothetical protein